MGRWFLWDVKGIEGLMMSCCGRLGSVGCLFILLWDYGCYKPSLLLGIKSITSIAR